MRPFFKIIRLDSLVLSGQWLYEMSETSSCEILKTQYTGTVGILQSRCGKFIMAKLKSSLLYLL